MSTGPTKLRRLDEGILNERDLITAEEELGETEKVKYSCLQELKTAIQEIDNFEPRTDDEFLLRFLRVSKFDTLNSLKRILKYYKTRKQYPEVFTEAYPSALTSILNSNKTHFIMPYRNTDNSMVYINRRGLNDPSKMVECLQLDVLFFELVFDNPLNQVHGQTSIVDFKGMGLNSIQMALPSSISRIINVTVGCMPIRHKKIHIVNGSPILAFIVRAASPFLSKKLKERLVFHRHGNDWSSLHHYVSPEALPEEYGGKLGPLDSFSATDLLMEKDNLFKEQLKYGYVK